MFYTFYQNNSGGYFEGPTMVIIEAHSADEANEIAEERAGIYFDGVALGRDCWCCGDRWYRVHHGEDVLDPETISEGALIIPL